MPTEAFAQVAGWSDGELAEVLAAPLDKVAIRRREVRGDSAAATLR
jgi:hypothetical protein